jgi:hypothetical protein
MDRKNRAALIAVCVAIIFAAVLVFFIADDRLIALLGENFKDGDIKVYLGLTSVLLVVFIAILIYEFFVFPPIRLLLRRFMAIIGAAVFFEGALPVWNMVYSFAAKAGSGGARFEIRWLYQRSNRKK